MSEQLQEFVDSRGAQVRVDQSAGVIRGIKILGLTSRNGRRYLPEALAAAAALYEGVKVNVNHPKLGPLAPRDYQDRIGSIRNVALREQDGLFGDLHFNPKHALAEQLVWDAQHAPENVGLSHNVEARTSRASDTVVVEAILKVQSVDLVADPATTRGLFESAAQSPVPSDALQFLTLEQLAVGRPDLIEAAIAEHATELAELRTEVDRLRAAEAAATRRLQAKTLLAEFALPDPDTGDPTAKALVSETFLQSLLAAPNHDNMRQLVAERAKLIREARDADRCSSRTSFRPRSRDQNQIESHAAAPVDARAFANSIC